MPMVRGGRPRQAPGENHLPVLNVQPVLLDPARLIYQYNDAAGGVNAVFDSGAAVYAYAGDAADLFTGTVPAGQYRTDNSRGLFQLGSRPVGTVTCDCY